VGNIFLGDDGFGVEAVRRLGEHPLPDGVEVVDAGVRGVHLAYQMLEGYHTVLLVDASARGGEPGTVYLLDATDPSTARPQSTALDGHHMTPDTVLALLDTLSAGTGGCRPRRRLRTGRRSGGHRTQRAGQRRGRRGREPDPAACRTGGADGGPRPAPHHREEIHTMLKLALGGAAAAVFALAMKSVLPDLRRYLRIRSM
jgi:hydrogenase maturation protease